MSDLVFTPSDPLRQCLDHLLAVQRQLGQVACQSQGNVESSLLPQFTSALTEVNSTLGLVKTNPTVSFPLPHYVPFAPRLPALEDNSSRYSGNWLDDSRDSSGETPSLIGNNSTTFDSTLADTSAGSVISCSDATAHTKLVRYAAFSPPGLYDFKARIGAMEKQSLTEPAPSERTSRKRALSTSAADDVSDPAKRKRSAVDTTSQQGRANAAKRSNDQQRNAVHPKYTVSERLRYDHGLWDELQNLIVHQQRKVTYWEMPRLSSAHPMKRLLYGLCAALDAFTTEMRFGEERVLRYHLDNSLSITPPTFHPAVPATDDGCSVCGTAIDADDEPDLSLQRFYYNALTSPEHPPTCLDFFDLIQRRLDRDGMALTKVTHITTVGSGFAAFELAITKS